ncbi:MAG: hypothetical protein JWP87_4959, partial [Labilithrix sp.]|nr:hypothetical protein [Labilithrix sp.]
MKTPNEALPPTTCLTWVTARPDGKLVAVGDDVGRLRVWCPGEARITACHLLGAHVRAATWTHDGQKLLAIAHGGGTLHVFSADGTQREAPIETGHGEVAGLSVHPSKALAATTGNDGFVRVWDLSTGKTALVVKEPSEGTVTAMSETHVAAGFRSGHFGAWKLETGKDAAGGEIFATYVSAMAFSPDGTSLVCGGGSGGLVELRTETWQAGEVWKSTPPKPIATNAITFAREQPSGRFLCAHSDDTTSLFTSRLERLPSSLGSAFWLDRKPWERAYIVSGACFVPNTKIILTSHFTGRLRVWKEGDVLTSKVAEIAFDDEGPKIVDRAVADEAAWWAQQKSMPAVPARPAPEKPKGPQTADIVRIGSADRRARNTPEMRFAASLHPCATCGGTVGKTEIYGNDGSHTLVGACPFCGRARSFSFFTEGDPVLAGSPPGNELGDEKPSRVIRPTQLLTELARVTPAIADEPRKLAPPAWRANGKAIDRALTCVLELLKFVPAGASAIPTGELDGDADHATRAWLTAERDRLLDLDARSTADTARIWEIEEGKVEPGGEIRGVLYQAYPRVPTAEDLRAYFETRKVRSIWVAGPNLQRAPWAKAVSGAADVFVELETGGLVGARLWDDSRGLGAWAELVLQGCTLKNVKDALLTHGNELQPMPRQAGAPACMIARPVVNGRKVMLVIEHDGDAVPRVLVSFDRGESAAPPVPPVAPPRDGIEKTCAACGTISTYPTASLFRKSPAVDYWTSGLDGRPSFGDTDLATDAALLAREFVLAQCPSCKHVAPHIDLPYPRAASKDARDELFDVPEHDDLARKYLYVAQLYNDEDPRQEGFWALYAAWADEAAGFAERGRRIRRRAGALLEDALFSRYALKAVRGASSVMLAEILRVAGDFERAAEHCRRGLKTAAAANEERFLLFEAQCILDHRSEPHTRAHARDRIEPYSAEQRAEIVRALERAYPTLPPLRLRPRRRFFHNRLLLTTDWSLTAEATVFVEDFLDEDVLIVLLRSECVG